MKILLISPLPPPAGGIATWTVRYKQYCKSNDIPLILVDNALIGSRKSQTHTKRNLIDELVRTLRVIFDLFRKIRAEKPDVIHLNSSCSRFGIFRDCICAMLSRAYSIPVVLQCHCNIQDQVCGRLAESAFQILVSMSQRVLALNRYSSDYARRFAGERVIVVPNFVEENDIYLRVSAADEIRRIIFVGHVQREKGAEEIIEAAAQFPEIQFNLVGPVGEEIRKLTCGSNVLLMGAQPHEKVLQLLREADAFLFPSHTEGFANALLEAMAAGLPVIATDVGANAEMIEDRGGIIIPAKDGEAIAGAIRALKAAPARCLSMSQWNTKKVRNTYLLSAVMERLMEIYKEVTT